MLKARDACLRMLSTVEKAVPAYSVVGVGRLSARVAQRPRIFAILVGASIRMGVVLVAFAGSGLCTTGPKSSDAVPEIIPVLPVHLVSCASEVLQSMLRAKCAGLNS